MQQGHTSELASVLRAVAKVYLQKGERMVRRIHILQQPSLLALDNTEVWFYVLT
jgi:hypothetical protein